MNTQGPALLVGRDRAHVRELVLRYPQAEVVSANSFFDKVRILAFLRHDGLRRDDVAPLIIAQNILAATKAYPLSMSKNFSALHTALMNGCASLLDEPERFKHSSPALKKAMGIAAVIEGKMAEKGLASSARALLLADEVMEKNKILPPALARTSSIELHHPVDLTPLQISVLKRLAALGLRVVVVLPGDFRGQSINAPVDYLATQLRAESSIELRFDQLAPLGLVRKCSKIVANFIDDEARQVAQKIAHIKMERPHDSVALCMRTRDTRFDVYKRALVSHGLSVSDAGGLALIDSSCGLLMVSLMAARLSNLLSKDLLGLIIHPMFSFSLEQLQDRSSINRLLNRLGIDDGMTAESAACRYSAKIDKYNKFLHVDSPEIAQLNMLRELILNINNVFSQWKNEDTLAGFLAGTLQILQLAAKPSKDQSSYDATLSLLLALKNSGGHDEYEEPIFTLREFLALLKSSLQSKTMVKPSSANADAVQMLTLPSMLGLQFDHVFVVDMAFGRLPPNRSADSLLNDDLRIELNQLFARPALAVLGDDPFEPRPVPPQQAMEPIWFACAVASARASASFSYARHDLAGQEQAASEYFAWLQQQIGAENILLSDTKLNTITTQENLRFTLGKLDAKCSPANELAFKIDEQVIANSFGGRIGMGAERALTPTFIEAFSLCRFKGLYERILRIDDDKSENDDVDMRQLGQIAHSVLEQIFAEPLNNPNKFHIAERVSAVLKKVIQQFVKDNYIKNERVFLCQSEWLEGALVRLVDEISLLNSDAHAQVWQREIPLGLNKSPYRPLPVEVNGRRYLLGGIIDRLDQNDEGLLVMDYKLSSVASLKNMMGPRALLKTHFQMPIYLRLVASHFANNDYKQVWFSFASIRDGALLKPVTWRGHQDLFEKIFNDEHPESLAVQIDAIFAPIIQGNIAPTVGDGCDYCSLSTVCRRDETL